MSSGGGAAAEVMVPVLNSDGPPTKAQETALSGADMKKLLPHVPITVYADLLTSPVDELFDAKGRCVVLFVAHDDPKGGADGHWLGLLRKGGVLEFFDPYGGTHDPWYFDRTLSGGASDGPTPSPIAKALCTKLGVQPEFNKHRFQVLESGMNTCGRHCVVRLQKHQLSFPEYKNWMDAQCSSDITPDDVVTQLTRKIE